MRPLVVLGVFQAGVALAATLTTVSPDLGDTYGGVPITCKGSGFTGATAVAIERGACSNLVVVDDTTIKCVAPSMPVGKHDVTVTTPGGPATLKAGYEAWSPKSLSPRARVYQSDQGTTSTDFPWYSWECTTTNMGAAFTPRDGAGLLYLGTNLFLLGGWNPDPAVLPYETCNEVWKSSDLGKTWKRILDHDEDVAWDTGSRWRRRHMAGCVVHNNLLYVIGGDQSDTIGAGNSHAKWAHHPSDVWSSPDGVTWTARTLNAPWGNDVDSPGREFHMVASFKGKLYVMGGGLGGCGSTALNDVWESSDAGTNWVRRMAHNPSPGTTRWMPRGMVTNPVEFNGKLWVIGGGTYDDSTKDNARALYNDVWSWDGVSTSWDQVLANGKAPWAERHYHDVLVFDNKLWVLGGYNTAGNNNDVWWSADGKTWTEVKDLDGTPWIGTHGGSFTTGGGYIFHAAGNGQMVPPSTKYAWRMSVKSGAMVSQWNDLGADGKHLYQPAQYDRPFRFPNELGTQPGIQCFGRQFMSLSPKAMEPDPETGVDAAYPRFADHGKTNSAFQVYVVGKSAMTATNHVSVSYPDNNPPYTLVGTASAENAYNQFGMKGGALEYDEFLSTSQKYEGGSGLNDGRCRLLWVQHKEGHLKLGVGTSTKKTVTTSAFGPESIGWQELGCGYGFEDKARFTFGAVVIIPDEIISAADLEKLNKWARKWGSVSE